MALASCKNLRRITSVVTNIGVRASSSEKPTTTNTPFTKFPKKILYKVEDESVEMVNKQKAEEITAYKKFTFELAGFHKYGLLRDDLYNELLWDVTEAIRRLPLRVKQERDYRILRAVQADIQNQILPQELWTKVDDDHYYLGPYVEEVKRERQEREDWEKTH